MEPNDGGSDNEDLFGRSERRGRRSRSRSPSPMTAERSRAHRDEDRRQLARPHPPPATERRDSVRLATEEGGYRRSGGRQADPGSSAASQAFASRRVAASMRGPCPPVPSDSSSATEWDAWRRIALDSFLAVRSREWWASVGCTGSQCSLEEALRFHRVFREAVAASLTAGKGQGIGWSGGPPVFGSGEKSEAVSSRGLFVRQPASVLVEEGGELHWLAGERSDEASLFAVMLRGVPCEVAPADVAASLGGIATAEELHPVLRDASVGDVRVAPVAPGVAGVAAFGVPTSIPRPYAMLTYGTLPNTWPRPGQVGPASDGAAIVSQECGDPMAPRTVAWTWTCIALYHSAEHSAAALEGLSLPGTFRAVSGGDVQGGHEANEATVSIPLRWLCAREAAESLLSETRRAAKSAFVMDHHSDELWGLCEEAVSGAAEWSACALNAAPAAIEAAARCRSRMTVEHEDSTAVAEAAATALNAADEEAAVECGSSCDEVDRWRSSAMGVGRLLGVGNCTVRAGTWQSQDQRVVVPASARLASAAVAGRMVVLCQVLDSEAVGGSLREWRSSHAALAAAVEEARGWFTSLLPEGGMREWMSSSGGAAEPVSIGACLDHHSIPEEGWEVFVSWLCLQWLRGVHGFDAVSGMDTGVAGAPLFGNDGQALGLGSFAAGSYCGYVLEEGDGVGSGLAVAEYSMAVLMARRATLGVARRVGRRASLPSPQAVWKSLTGGNLEDAPRGVLVSLGALRRSMGLLRSTQVDETALSEAASSADRLADRAAEMLESLAGPDVLVRDAISAKSTAEEPPLGQIATAGETFTRCGLCSKLFRSFKFAAKHMLRKHPEAFEESLVHKRSRLRQALLERSRQPVARLSLTADSECPGPTALTGPSVSVSVMGKDLHHFGIAPDLFMTEMRRRGEQGTTLAAAARAGAAAAASLTAQRLTVEAAAVAAAAARSVAMYRDKDAPTGLAASVTEKPDYSKSFVAYDAL
jgi:uncharacterized C2H2 Zn-finger protein